jgi:hypothetical protein
MDAMGNPWGAEPGESCQNRAITGNPQRPFSRQGVESRANPGDPGQLRREYEMTIGAGEGQRNPQSRQWLTVLRGGLVGAVLLVGSAQAHDAALPANLVWVCAYSDSQTRCFDTWFESPTVVDCGNARPLTDYEGGSGVMVLTDAVGERHVYAYGSRSYNVRGGPGNLDVIRLFPVDGIEFGSKGDFEHCETHVRR